jgi:fructose-1,6-bisphosphatase/inositol monophosphatase family enzyme
MTYRDFAVNLAKQAGANIRKNFTLGMKKEWKADESPLTATDTMNNALVIKSVKKAFPDHGIIAEEGSDYDGQELVWVCDPLDGTIPFSHGVPTSCFSIALVHAGQPILGVIFDPYMDRLFVAEKGRGTTLNGKKVSVSSTKTLKNTFLASGVPKVNCADLRSMIVPFADHGARILDMGVIVYPGALVASGEFAGTVFSGTMPWDGATLKINVEEAGGRVTDLYGNDQRYDRDLKGHVTSNGHVHNEILAIITPFLPPSA